MDLDKFVKKRGSVKAKLTIFEKYVYNLTVSYPDFTISEEEVFLELEQRLERFQTIIDDFEDLQGQIDEATDDPDTQLKERETFERAFYGVVAKSKRFLRSSDFNNEDSDQSSQRSVRVNNIEHSGSADNASVRLPVIEIMTFNGDHDRWLEFRDTFETLIHENSKLADIQKYHYLRAYLGPNVREIIASLEISASNYGCAWKLICDRFNNNRILIQNHVKALFDLQKIHKESSGALRSIIDNVSKHLRALKTLNEPIDSWDTLVIYLITAKLDDVTLRKWEQLKGSYTTPTLVNMSAFLKERADLLESVEYCKPGNTLVERQGKTNRKTNVLHANNNSPAQPKCTFCKGGHYIQNCNEFLKLDINNRIEQAKRKRLCLNCLRPGHLYKHCFSGTCKICNLKHHSLIHRNEAVENDNKRDSSDKLENHSESINLSARNTTLNQVLLSTVLLNILDKNNKPHTARALLDVGSQSSFLTERLCTKLQLPKTPINMKVSGLNETESNCKNKCIVRVLSRVNQFSAELSCLLVPQITGALPNFRLDSSNLEIPDNVKLADPNFNIPGEIDMLIGADWFWDLLCVGQIKLGTKGPYLQKSKFGWIVSGRVQAGFCNNVQCNLIKHPDINDQLSRFWEIEEFPIVKPLSTEERACENHFLSNYKRDENGRFVVTIPLLDSVEKLGDSYKSAYKRFLSLERKLERDDTLKKRYFEFIDEYRNLGHMVKVKDLENTNSITYYMPHHGVIKESSLTTKLRVVFDASCPSSSGYSFNDLQMVGATIQSDLFSILLRHRKHDYVIGADIEKMYRMCRINPDQGSLQRILWRDQETEQVEVYELLTVTYGTRSAAYLAIRCLYQLGIENEIEYPNASRAIKEDFYVDDLLTGANSVDTTVCLANEISSILIKAGFHLRKWVSNSSEVLSNIKTEDKSDIIDLGSNENTKTLGLIWNGRKDCLSYKVGAKSGTRITKRSVLSEIAQIFDPLGLLSATIILAKIILRDIWLEKIDWDQSLSHTLHTRWLQFRDDLTALNELNIDRQVTCKNLVKAEIHGFSDASAYAYGACIYLKSENTDGQVFVRLICAKSKVAPLKTQTIPRLELTAALLLSRLIDKVKASLNMPLEKVVYWCDSMIVLGWLHMNLNQLQVFVANRVAAIQDLSNVNDWRHVPTRDNPADFVSRGVRPSDLSSLELYWYGPKWLSLIEDFWPRTQYSKVDLPDLRKTLSHTQTVDLKAEAIDFDNYSSLTRLERIIAYCLRFKNNCLSSNENRISGPLKIKEINQASFCLIRISQGQCFGNEITSLKKNANVDKSSKIFKLNPFLDEGEIIRVGGRLANSNFNYNKKYPIVLASNHNLTKLLFVQEHIRLLHAGPQLLLTNIRDRFWPVGGRNLARKTYHNCVRCFKAKPKSINPIMGHLPNKRVNPAPPFYTTGVDYAGPFFIRDRQGRGFKVTKAYMCLFICFVTRAIHLELVSDLTTEAFIAALRRFVSRRGKPSQIYSDNGSNFLGANQELRQLGKFLQENSAALSEHIENDGISWSFIPAHSPHFGGLWEAGVKAVKFHLKRVAGQASLTFEKLYTLLVQIEAVLNSRPLCPLSSDPADYAPLTPSHFLIHRPMVSIVDPDLTHVADNRLSHFQHVQKLQQHFWSRWSMEYISELQQRSKWRSNHEALKLNDLVVVKDDNLPPCRWVLGRIEALHPGKDGVSRVATIRTMKGNIKRSFAKICPLPL